MIGRLAHWRRGCIEIANFQSYPKRPSSGTVAEARNRHPITINIKGCLGTTTLPSGCLVLRRPPHHDFCTRTKVRPESSSAKSSSESTRVRHTNRKSIEERDEALRLEAKAYANSLKATKGRDGFLKEKNQLSIKRELGFCGKIFIGGEDGAMDLAEELFENNRDPYHLVLFVDGSVMISSLQTSGAPVTCAGAAVVYRPLGDDHTWVERYFAPATYGKRPSVAVETGGILNGLKVSAVEVDSFRCPKTGYSDATVPKIRVTIVSDCVSALQLLQKLQDPLDIDFPLLSDCTKCELMAVSQYLDRRGVEVELHWVRGHSRARGNILADHAARYAAKHPDISAILEKQFQVKVKASSSCTGARDSKQHKLSREAERKKVPSCEIKYPATLSEAQNPMF